MHHSDDTSEATQATLNERLREYHLSESPRPKTSPRQILEVLCAYKQESLYGKASSRARSRLGTGRFPVDEVCVTFTAGREPLVPPLRLFSYCRLLPPREIPKCCERRQILAEGCGMETPTAEELLLECADHCPQLRT